MAKTRYSQEYIENLGMKFIIKFNLDPRTLNQKLKATHLCKGSYSAILNNRPVSKRTLEIMRAYLENRTPKFLLIKKEEFYCGECEQILPLQKKRASSKWSCRACADQSNQNYKKTIPSAKKRREKYWKRMKDPKHRAHVLKLKKACYERKKLKLKEVKP